MRSPFTSIKNASGSPQIQSAARCGGSGFADASADRPACECGRSNGTLPNNRSCVADNTRIFHGPIRRTSPGFTASPDEAPARLVRFWRDMTQSIVDAGRIWLNARTKCHAQKIHAREIRIDQQGVSFEFELVTVRAEISHAHAVARCARRIGQNQPGIWLESTGKCLCGQHQEKKKTHVTTNNPA